MDKEGKTNFLKIFGGILLSGIGIVIIGNSNSNIWGLLLGIIFIASGIAILLKE